NAEKTPTMESVIAAFGRRKPGDEITVTVNRGKESLAVTAKLGRNPAPINPQELMGSVLSNRRGGFPLILQHDTVLKHTDCGGPLVDLDSKVVGINIPRAGRVESYAIPAAA